MRQLIAVVADVGDLNRVDCYGHDRRSACRSDGVLTLPTIGYCPRRQLWGELKIDLKSLAKPVIENFFFSPCVRSHVLISAPAQQLQAA